MYEWGVSLFNETIVLAQFNLEWPRSVREPAVHFLDEQAQVDSVATPQGGCMRTRECVSHAA